MRPHDNTIYLDIKLAVKCKRWLFGCHSGKSGKSVLDTPLTKVFGFSKSFFMQKSLVLSSGTLVNKT